MKLKASVGANQSWHIFNFSSHEKSTAAPIKNKNWSKTKLKIVKITTQTCACVMQTAFLIPKDTSFRSMMLLKTKSSVNQHLLTSTHHCISKQYQTVKIINWAQFINISQACCSNKPKLESIKQTMSQRNKVTLVVIQTSASVNRNLRFSKLRNSLGMWHLGGTLNYVV